MKSTNNKPKSGGYKNDPISIKEIHEAGGTDYAKSCGAYGREKFTDHNVYFSLLNHFNKNGNLHGYKPFTDKKGNIKQLNKWKKPEVYNGIVSENGSNYGLAWEWDKGTKSHKYNKINSFYQKLYRKEMDELSTKLLKGYKREEQLVLTEFLKEAFPEVYEYQQAISVDPQVTGILIHETESPDAIHDYVRMSSEEYKAATPQEKLDYLADYKDRLIKDIQQTSAEDIKVVLTYFGIIKEGDDDNAKNKEVAKFQEARANKMELIEQIVKFENKHLPNEQGEYQVPKSEFDKVIKRKVF